MSDEPPLLAIEGVSKSFVGTKVLHNVSLTVRRGQIHALLGENGAGKSTLIKIAAGVIQADAGHVRWQGEAVDGFTGLPIAFIHQDLGLVDTMSIAENVALVAGYARRGKLIDWKKTAASARDVLARLGSDLDPLARIGNLGSAERSIIAIARALAVRADVLVLDEPTAALPEDDVVRLLAVLRRLADDGMGIVYVTHRLDEVYRLADRVTVLRDGVVVHAATIAETPPALLVEKIVGKALGAIQHRPRTVASGRPTLEVDGLFTFDAGPVSFNLYAGETLGLVGLRGAGHHSIGRALFGDTPVLRGRIALDGSAFEPERPAGALARSIGLLPGKRREEGLSPSLTVRENLYLNPAAVGIGMLSVLWPGKELAACLAALLRYAVRPPDPERIVSTLSGGNQQKVVIGRWIESAARLLILEEPTAGVDVGSKAEIYQLLEHVLQRGVSILLVSSDFEEVVRTCDRALVFNRGKILSEIDRDDLSIAALTSAAGDAPISIDTLEILQ